MESTIATHISKDLTPQRQSDQKWETIVKSQLAAEAARKAAVAEAARQAAIKAAAIATQQAIAAQAPVAPPPLPTGSHQDWMAAAGIASSDFGYVDYIVRNESGWQVTIWNHGGSGAYGLGQALPATKMALYGADYLTNPVTQLRWATAYAVSRYGSWYKAYLFWSNNHLW